MKMRKTFLLLFCLFAASSITASAAGTEASVKSRGKIYFNNKTPEDPSDDVIFDAEDILCIARRIDILAEICR